MKSIKVNDWREVPENFTGVVRLPNNSRFWFKKGKYHRLDGPAIEYLDGSRLWYKDDKVHREDGPAVERVDGDIDWYLEGKIYYRINLENYIVLDYYKGEYGVMWYKLLSKIEILNYPDIPGLITKE